MRIAFVRMLGFVIIIPFEAAIADVPIVPVPPHVRARPGLGFSRGGDRESLRLVDADVALIRAVAAANPRTVVVVQAGSAVVMSEWDDAVAAIVQPFYGGQQSGNGLADVVFGAVNPSARLPFTVPVAESDLVDFDREADRFTYDRWHGWWRAERLGLSPAYPFGFGLSYTTFELGDFTANFEGDEIAVAGSVINTGDRDGADVVQVYAELPDAGAPRRLIGFARIEVAAGASADVEIRCPTPFVRDPVAHSLVPVTPIALEVARYVGDPARVSLDV